MTQVRAMLGDITTIMVDAIVNAANSGLLGGGGVDGAIHRVGGPSILEECRKIRSARGGCPPGDAVVTGAGALPARWVIHTVGPIWSEAEADIHDQTLSSAYERSLAEAEKLGAASVAFPNISTGVYGFPKRRAARIALNTVRAFVDAGTAVELIVFVCFDQENLGIYQELGCPT